MRINYIRLLTTNYDDMIQFYRETLQLELTHRNDQAKYAEFKTETSSISIFDKKNMAKALDMDYPETIHECQDKNMIVLYTDSFDEFAAALHDKHIVPLMGATERPEWGTRTLHLRDPDGNLIEIYTSL